MRGSGGSKPRATRELSRERVSGIQRTRLLGALADVCAERGAANVTVAHVVERAGVSRRTFYELFSDYGDCFLAGLDDALARLADRMVPAYERPGRWRERIRAALGELLSFLDEDPACARLVIVEALAVGREALERRARVLGHVVDAVADGCREASAGLAPTRLTAEGVVGGVLAVLHTRLLEGSHGSFVELLNPLMSMVVQPYLGPAAGRRELERPQPLAAPRGIGNGANPFKDLQIRLTYRTVRVLMAVAAEEGGSNRVVGDLAGIADQAQISKLLSRLKKLGLIANTEVPRAQGAPNAWVLTSRGEEVLGVVAH